MSGLVVESQPAVLKVLGSNRGGELKNFQNWLSSADTQQPVDRMEFESGGVL